MAEKNKMAYIGLGSNLEKPKQQITQATQALAKIANSKVVACSSLYVSKPMGPQDQSDYINAIIALETSLPALALLDALQDIENLAGRVRKDNRWGARILDCDIILYGDETIDSERLTVPHYGMKLREFVLLPLAEIAPNLYLPDGSFVPTLASEINPNGIVKLSF